jgi:hypothetical protein
MLLLVSVRGYAIRIVLLCIAITLPALSGAEDLAQGHHLWTVATANSGKTFIAAGTYATDSRADVILNRQIKAIGNVKLVALSSDGRDAWMRKALFGLQPDAYRRHRDITGSILADLAEPILTKPGPNLIVAWEIEDLGGSSGLIATLQRRGFRITPLALPDLP